VEEEMTRLRMLSLFAVGLSACNGPAAIPSSGREAALAHVQASSELRQRSEALRQQGWTVAALEGATIDWLRASGEKASPTQAEWTRVSLDVAKDGVAAALILAWPSDGGPDQFAIQPASRDGAVKLVEAMAAGGPLANNAEPNRVDQAQTESLEADSVQPLACNREGASCAASGSCCYGLSCAGQDNHEHCYCSRAWTKEFPLKGLINPIVCLPNPENPFSEGFIMRYWSGCDSGSSYGLAQGMCGTEVVPAYTRGISDSAPICFAGSPC
jgi:hypothetical protein